MNQPHLASTPSTPTVLLTGGTGTVGSALLPLLLDHGCRVRLLDLALYGDESIQPWLEHPRLEFIRGDFRQDDLVRSLLQGVDIVVHLGAIVADQACELDERLALEVNLRATERIATAARASGVGLFVFASTCSLYGSSDVLLNESSPINPVTLYARTKAEAERSLLRIADDSFNPVILRFSTIYGLSGRCRFDLVVNLLAARALLDGAITIHGGSQWRAFVHVDDVAQAILTVLSAPVETVRRQVFNVGSTAQNYTIDQLGEMIHRQVPQAHIERQAGRLDPQNYRVSSDKLARTLGFSPRWSVEQGIRQVIEAIQTGRVTDYRESRYSNLKFLSEGGLERLRCAAKISSPP